MRDRVDVVMGLQEWEELFRQALGGLCAASSERSPEDRVRLAAKVADEAVRVLIERRREAFREFDEPPAGGSSGS